MICFRTCKKVGGVAQAPCSNSIFPFFLNDDDDDDDGDYDDDGEGVGDGDEDVRAVVVVYCLK